MKAKDFENECQEKLTYDIWKPSWSPNYTIPISLSIDEMRDISNALRLAEGRKQKRKTKATQ